MKRPPDSIPEVAEARCAICIQDTTGLDGLLAGSKVLPCPALRVRILLDRLSENVLQKIPEHMLPSSTISILIIMGSWGCLAIVNNAKLADLQVGLIWKVIEHHVPSSTSHMIPVF